MVRRLECPVEGCTRGRNVEAGGVFRTEDDFKTLDQVFRSLELHVEAHKLGAAAQTPAPQVAKNQNQSRILKSVPPKVEMGISCQEWEYFLGDWKLHKGYCGLREQNDLVYNLWWCLSADLK